MSFGNFDAYKNVPPPLSEGYGNLASLSAAFRQQQPTPQPTVTSGPSTSPDDPSPTASGSGKGHESRAGSVGGDQPKKKRPRVSANGNGTIGSHHAGQGQSDDDELDGDGEDGDGKKKRSRQALSCASCKKRKIKCDRKVPCISCIKRGTPDECSWDEAKINPTPQPFALVSDVRLLASRLAQVEAFLQTLPPELRVGAPRPSLGLTSSRLAPTEEDHAAMQRHERASSAGQGDANSDTELAAVELEAMAFGGTGLSAMQIPRSPDSSKPFFPSQHAQNACFGTLPTPADADSLGPSQREPTRALTSIIAVPVSAGLGASFPVAMGLEFGLTPIEAFEAKNKAILKIFTVFPTQAQSQQLVDTYFTRFDWIHHVINRVCFDAEHERFWEMQAAGRHTEIDPLWLAEYAMIICLSLEGLTTGTSIQKRPAHVNDLINSITSSPAEWFAASQRLMQLGDWNGTPTIRAIVVIILYGQWIQVSNGGGQASRYFQWLASGIRLAQILGLDRLGDKDDFMPPDDPAFPPGKNSVKRQMALRIFNCLLFMDCLSASPRFPVYMLNPNQYTSSTIPNVNDADLSPTEWRINALPRSIATDSSFEHVKSMMAAQARRVFDKLIATKAASDFSYDVVLELDRGYRALIEELPDVWRFEHSAKEIKDPYLRWRRHVCHEGLNARLVRLHRPFLTRGYQANSKFRYSMEQCVASAKIVVASHHNIIDASNNVWFVYNHALGSAIVLFCDLFYAIDNGASDAEIEHKKETLVLAFEIFGRWDEIVSPTLRMIVRQGARVLSALFMAEEKRRVTRATISKNDRTSVETFAQVLQRISRELDLNPPSSKGAPAAEPMTFDSSWQMAPPPTVPVPLSNVDLEQMDGLPPGFFQDLGIPTIHNNNVNFWAQPQSSITPPDFNFLTGLSDWSTSTGAPTDAERDANSLAANALLEQLTSDW